MTKQIVEGEIGVCLKSGRRRVMRYLSHVFASCANNIVSAQNGFAIVASAVRTNLTAYYAAPTQSFQGQGRLRIPESSTMQLTQANKIVIIVQLFYHVHASVGR